MGEAPPESCRGMRPVPKGRARDPCEVPGGVHFCTKSVVPDHGAMHIMGLTAVNCLGGCSPRPQVGAALPESCGGTRLVPEGRARDTCEMPGGVHFVEGTAANADAFCS